MKNITNKNYSASVSKKSFRSSSTVLIPEMPKFSTKTLATLGLRNAGRVGPRWMFFTPRYKSANRTITATVSDHYPVFVDVKF